MIIQIIYNLNVFAVHSKGDAPVPGYAYRINSGITRFQQMKFGAGKIHFLCRSGQFQVKQNQSQPDGMFRLYPSGVTRFTKTRQTLMPKT